ncbi:YciI family protein [Nonomuraea jabiensis]|uniref:YCII-related domain-containing protein n=1 Tax=Nonomuraea jabiensis TaxID=882448 RepID=A0A7W9LFB3_9ACTN|nr:YciI family protein [Nonomuraea jabiensis]MBB5781573.1 hypothetical protein [Nonomuraea jabiensis]
MREYRPAVQFDENAPWPAEEDLRQRARTSQVTADIQAASCWVFVGGLAGSHATTVVRPGDGTTTMTDGPFAGTKEQLGGFWVVQCVRTWC